MELLQRIVLNSSVLLLISLLICECAASEVPRPRGVSLSRSSLYNPSQNFVCFDNSKTIPFSQVNDDYCDCLDASDEPGTSACPHGTFHCTNAGHKPQNLISSRVNDGICDCCDGTDEYANKDVNCANVCLQLGRTAREEAQRLAELVKAGKQLKHELSQKGIQLKQEKKEKLKELEKNREEAERIKQEKLQIKDQVEVLESSALEHYRKLEEEEKRRQAELEDAKNREEASETFNRFDSNQDGVVDVAELQTRQTFDKDNNGEVSDEEARMFLNNEDAVDLEKFITDAWPNIKPALMKDAGLFKPPTPESNANQEELDDLRNEEGEDDGDDEEEEEEPYQPEEKENTINYDENTQKLVDDATSARNEFAQAEKAVRDIDNEIKEIKEYLEKDFGPDEEFGMLQGQCFEYDDHEYIYKLCPFEKTVQLPKSGSTENRLGTWGHWSGPESNIYESMMYDHGQSCWNGPQRSTQVKVLCGTENQVISVSEPNRCEYLFEFTTPAACREITSDTSDDSHDEL